MINKKQVNELSQEIRGLINNGFKESAEQKIKSANLTTEEMNFLHKCLQADGYDPNTDMFILYESDNSAFLDLVKQVMDNVKKNK